MAIAARKNRDAGQYRAHRTDCIGQHMKKCAANIQVFMMLSKQDPRARQIGKQAEHGDDEHPVGFD